MKNLILRKLTPSDEMIFNNTLMELDYKSIQQFAFDYGYDRQFSNYVTRLNGYELGINLPKGSKPLASLYAFLDDKIIARVYIYQELIPPYSVVPEVIEYAFLNHLDKYQYLTEIIKQARYYAQCMAPSNYCLDTNMPVIVTESTLMG